MEAVAYQRRPGRRRLHVVGVRAGAHGRQRAERHADGQHIQHVRLEAAADGRAVGIRHACAARASALLRTRRAAALPEAMTGAASAARHVLHTLLPGAHGVTAPVKSTTLRKGHELGGDDGVTWPMVI